MKKYKVVEEKIEEALKISRETGKEHGFNICQSGVTYRLSVNHIKFT